VVLLFLKLRRKIVDEPRMSAFRRESPRSRSTSARWIDRWLAACSELAELERSNPMTDAVIDEVDGRMIRIGSKWLADFASCNYLGFDLDREIIAAVPGYLEKWGTHPSWSRMLGSPSLYPLIEDASWSSSAARTPSCCRRSL
jgi:7-keto-8-aminopelargonate synthetase-like enzyme